MFYRFQGAKDSPPRGSSVTRAAFVEAGLAREFALRRLVA
jgi:hypothetical protein